MVDLIWKDLYVSSRLLLLVILVGLIQLAVFASVGPIFLLAAVLFAGLLGFGPIFVEDANRTEILWNSLPVSRKRFVTARYVSVFLGIAVGLGISWVVGQAITRIMPPGAGVSAPFVSHLTLSLLFVPLAFTAAVFLPFYFRSGLGRGLVHCMVTMAVISLGSSLLAKLVLQLMGYSAPLLDTTTWTELGPKLVSWVSPRWGLILGALVGSGTFAIAVSCLLSWRLYRARDV